ncbi:MAG: glycine cleavage system protein H [Acutalibacteraceae bacterium]
METYYTKTHEWVRFPSPDTAVVGVTAYWIQKQKDPSCINLCDEGDYLNAGDVAGDIEFLKGVFDIHAPVSGEVSCVHDDLFLSPQTLKTEPFTWLFQLTEIERPRKLLTQAQYEAYLHEREERNG